MLQYSLVLCTHYRNLQHGLKIVQPVPFVTQDYVNNNG